MQLYACRNKVRKQERKPLRARLGVTSQILVPTFRRLALILFIPTVSVTFDLRSDIYDPRWITLRFVLFVSRGNQ